jgi:hypothetical protein
LCRTRTYLSPHPRSSPSSRRCLWVGGEKGFSIDNLLVRIHFIIEMIWWAGLAPWEFEFPFLCSRVSIFPGQEGVIDNSDHALRRRDSCGTVSYSLPGPWTMKASLSQAGSFVVVSVWNNHPSRTCATSPQIADRTHEIVPCQICVREHEMWEEGPRGLGFRS